MLRLRQLCLVANDLNQIERDLKSIFQLEVCHRDPGVEKFGLHNFLMPIDTNFLEVVAPFEENTSAGRYLKQKGGDSGYMIIMQCDDVKNVRKTRDFQNKRVCVSYPSLRWRAHTSFFLDKPQFF